MRYDVGRFRRPMRRSTEGQLVSLISLGDGSTLTLDFTTGVLDQRLTFTRSSTATYINSSGYVTSIGAAPTNDPTKARFDHDPTTGSPRGLLIEGSATNLLSRSEEFDNTSSWFAFNRTVTPNDGVSPDGNTTADSIQATTSGIGGVFHATSCPIGTHTFSLFAKANGANVFTVSIDTSSNGRAVDITLTGGGSAGTPYVRGTGGTVTSMTASVQPFPSGWVRCIITVVTTGTNSIALYTQTGTSKWLAWGAQLETGSGASSYIPTGASTGTRNPEYCSITSPNFAPWYGSPTGWTVVAEMTPQSRAAGSFPGMIALRSAADSGLRIYYYNDGTYNTAFRFATASTGTEVYGPNGVTYGVPRKFGASVTSGTQIASSAGVQIGSTQTLAVPMDQTLFAIGSDGLSPTPAVNCRMHFRSIKYWPYAMTLADLNARTT